MFSSLAGRLSAAVLALHVASPLLAAEKRLMTETDLFRFVWIADPQVSPDGSRVAFVRVTVDEKKEGYETAIWVVPTDGSEPARAFTAGPKDASPRWSNDGRYVAFVRSVTKDGKAEPQLHVIPAGGGEARALTALPQGIAGPVWSPQGRSLAFTSTANAKDLEKSKRKRDKSASEAKDDDRESDVRVVTRAVYRYDGAGFLDPTRPSHVWTIELGREEDKSEPQQVTSGEFAASNVSWSPDGRRLFFTSSHVKEPAYAPQDEDLWSVPREGGEPRLEASIDGPINEYALNGDGTRVAFTGSMTGKPVRSYDQPDLFVADLPAGPAKNLTADDDFDIDSGVIGDQRAPRGSLPTPLLWERNQKSLIVKAAEKGRGGLKRVDILTGQASDLTTGAEEILAYGAGAQASTIAVVVSTPIAIGDLFQLDPATGTARALYRPNQDLFGELDLAKPEELTWKSFDGRSIHGFILKPPRAEAGTKHPLILNIHGGPHAAYGHVFMHEFQWMAARGYVVLYPNPRGSSSYGQEFGNVIQHRYPGDDYKDLMAGVDELIKRGIVDPARLGVTGGSGGGVLTNWAITQTDRFRAAVSQRSISDWAGWWYTADFSMFQPYWFRGAPFEVPAEYAERSPITRVARVKTPLMLIEGAADDRTPAWAGGEQMFRALKYRKVPTVMVRFPGETHDLSRTGQPWHRIERLQHIVAWFDRYLLGKATIDYDVP